MILVFFFFFFFFYLPVTLILPVKLESICFSVQKFKIDFQDGDCGGHIAFPIRINLAIFNLQVTQILPTKFLVNWPLGSAKEAQNKFLSGHGGHLGFRSELF